MMFVMSAISYIRYSYKKLKENKVASLLSAIIFWLTSHLSNKWNKSMVMDLNISTNSGGGLLALFG